MKQKSYEDQLSKLKQAKLWNCVDQYSDWLASKALLEPGKLQKLRLA
jgi:hypothetical protein